MGINTSHKTKQNPRVVLLLKNMMKKPRKSSKKMPSDNQNVRLFREDFAPGDYDVVCARGNQAWNHPGNKFLRFLVEQAKHRYGNANRRERSTVVSNIVEAVRCLKGDGFIKQNKNKRWYEIGDYLAREKVGQLLRNANGNIYRSSTTFKKRRRKEVNPKVFGNFHNILQSNPKVSQIMHNLNRIVRQSEEFTDEEVLAMLNDANSQLLSSFKEDISLVERFNAVERHAGYEEDDSIESFADDCDEATPMVE
jgi:hypothetical protein